MPVYVSLLRGINIGGHHKIKMDALKALYASLGLTDAKSHLQSGNVVFASGRKDRAKLAAEIETAIEKAHGFRPAVMLRDAAALRRIVRENPFPDAAENDPSHLVVMFLSAKPDKDAAKRLAAAYDEPEEIRISGDNATITYPAGIGTSKLTAALLEKHLGVTATGRNWNTVTKLLAMAEALRA